MRYHYEFLLVKVTINGTILDCIIRGAETVGQTAGLGFQTCVAEQRLFKFSFINNIISIHCFLQPIDIVIHDDFLLGSCDGIMVHKHSHSVKHFAFGSQNVLYLSISDILVDNSLCIQLIRRMKICRAVFDHLFGVWPRDIVARPIALCVF